MQRYLIELTHDSDHESCIRALAATERHGGHFALNVEWGCLAGVHSGWLIVDLDHEYQAKQMVAPEFRDDARIVKLDKFSKEDILSWVAKLEDKK